MSPDWPASAPTRCLLSVALGSVALLLVAWLRTGAAVTALAVYLALSYLLTYLVRLLSCLVRLFSWPDWISRLSLSGAYGNPYLQWPAWTWTAAIVAVAVAGFVAATVAAARSSKTAQRRHGSTYARGLGSA